jgi:hypothetical protein
VSVRELIGGIRKEVIAGNVSPARAGDLAAQLSALLGNITDEVLEAEMAYNAKLVNLLAEHEAKARAEVYAKSTEEYRRLRGAEGMHTDTLEMVRSLRKVQDTYRAEIGATR